MKITQVTVSAGRTIPHPVHEYSNLRPHVSITADIESDDDPEEIIIMLQAKAEQLVETHGYILEESVYARYKLQKKTQKPQDLLELLNHARKKWYQLQQEDAEQPVVGNSYAICRGCGELQSNCSCVSENNPHGICDGCGYPMNMCRCGREVSEPI